MFQAMKANQNWFLGAAFSSAAVLCTIGAVVSSLRLFLGKADHLGTEKLSCGGFALRAAGFNLSVFPERVAEPKLADPAERVIIPSPSWTAFHASRTHRLLIGAIRWKRRNGPS